MVLVALLVIFILILIVILYDINNFTLDSHICEDDRVKALRKVCVIADLHNHSFGKNNKRLLHELYMENPDRIFIAGDLFNASRRSLNKNAIKFMENLALDDAAPWHGRIYFSYGNHEMKLLRNPEKYRTDFAAAVRRMKDLGIHILDNSFVEDDGVIIAGINIPKELYKKRLKKLPDGEDIRRIIGFDADDRTVLLAHNPEFFPAYEEWGARVVFSGHVHGGIVRLPKLGGMISPRLRLFPKYDGGIYRLNDSLMILSRGLSWHTLPIRFMNAGELIMMEFRKQQDGYSR